MTKFVLVRATQSDFRDMADRRHHARYPDSSPTFVLFISLCSLGLVAAYAIIGFMQ